MKHFRVEDLCGIHAALYALFDGRGKLDRAVMRRQVEICLASGTHGMVALGLATEASKLDEVERMTVMDWVVDDAAGRAPVALTILGSSVEEQVRQVRHAQAAGADWLILQPPTVDKYSAAEYVRFLSCVAEKTDLPLAIQNAPALVGRDLATTEIRDLVRKIPTFVL